VTKLGGVGIVGALSGEGGRGSALLTKAWGFFGGCLDKLSTGPQHDTSLDYRNNFLSCNTI